jgi:hypothetical protein
MSEIRYTPNDEPTLGNVIRMTLTKQKRARS